MYFCKILVLLGVMLIISCGDKGNKVTLLANNDGVTSLWSNALSIDVLENDFYEENAEVIITKQPLYGLAVVVSNNTILYIPNEDNEIEDEFSYYLKQGDYNSDAAKVSLSLMAKVSSVTLPEVDYLEEGYSYPINVLFSVPLLKDASLIVERYVDGIIDNNYIQQPIIVEAGTKLLNWDYYLEIKESAGDYNQNHELVFYLDNAIIVKSSNTYLSQGIPDPDLMNVSTKPLWYNEIESNRIINNGQFVLTWMNYPAWDMPSELMWDEDPFNNKSWLLYYHSLSWLFAYEYAYNNTNDETHLDSISDAMFDYVIASPKSNPKNYMSWDDFTVALRTDNLLYFYNRYFKKIWDDSKREKFLSAMAEHAAELRTLLDSNLFFAHNHSMYHALSLYNYSFALPSESAAFDYSLRSKERMEELYEEMVDDSSGVSVEQSSNYHMGAIKLFSLSNELIYALSGTYNQALKPKIEAMIDFAAHLMFPNGGAPTMGDSNYGDTGYLTRLNRSLEKKGLTSDYLTYVNSKGEEGDVLENVFASEESGYAILRPEGVEDWQNQTVILFDAGKKRYSHGHDDALNFTLFTDGESLLIDAGGPFIYSRQERDYYRSKYAHNSLIIDSQKYDDVDASLVEAECLETYCYTIGEISQRGLNHIRVLLSTRNSAPVTYVFDYVRSPMSHEFELLYHFPPDSEVIPGSTDDTIAYISGKKISVRTIASMPLTKQYYNGFGSAADENKQGWVSPKYALEVPAPVISYNSNGKGYWSLTEINPSLVSEPAELTSEAGNKFKLTSNNLSITIDLSDPSKAILYENE
jgi:hypothetical protein